MKIKEVAEALERFAPLPLQESYDNAGLQIGLTEVETSGVLLCLDVTESVIEEAVGRGCNLVVAHHPLLFRGVKQLADVTLVERCVRLAIQNNIAIYAAHTNLDNAEGGVNHLIAERLGLQQVSFLLPGIECSGVKGGSGIVGYLPHPEQPEAFLQRVAKLFGVACLMHNDGPQKEICKIAVCGGAGEFLIDEAVAQEADVFLTGEIGYHHFFGWENKIWLGALGHYQSEQFTVDLLARILQERCPELRVVKTQLSTNPIKYMWQENK
ncbi:MAG: Nif3-like dinuclear metal center hexameric protein [Bacteroidaceae bacterium]|nr:Nif3-like dinuclear metal center hexameric protein [Bacteroidaceae bacterium]